MTGAPKEHASIAGRLTRPAPGEAPDDVGTQLPCRWIPHLRAQHQPALGSAQVSTGNAAQCSGPCKVPKPCMRLTDRFALIADRASQQGVLDSDSHWARAVPEESPKHDWESWQYAVLCTSTNSHSPDPDPPALTPGSLRPGLSRHHWESEQLLRGETGPSSACPTTADLIMAPAVVWEGTGVCCIGRGQPKSRTLESTAHAPD